MPPRGLPHVTVERADLLTALAGHLAPAALSSTAAGAPTCRRWQPVTSWS